MKKTTSVQATSQEQTTSGNQSISWTLSAEETNQLMQLLSDGKELAL